MTSSPEARSLAGIKIHIDFAGAQVIYLRVLLLTGYNKTTTTQDCTCTLHPPSLSLIMSQKPHKNWVLQTPPPWASHGQEIGRSFTPGSWPWRSCLSLLKSHKMKTFTEVSQALPGKEDSEPASGMHPPPKLALGNSSGILATCA